MEELQTDTLSNYEKTQNKDDLDTSRENENAAALLNGCEEVDDPLDLMDHCDNESIGSNSDVWKGSDSEDDNFESRDISKEAVNSNKGTEKETDKSMPNDSDEKIDNPEQTDATDPSKSVTQKSEEASAIGSEKNETEKTHKISDESEVDQSEKSQNEEKEVAETSEKDSGAEIENEAEKLFTDGKITESVAEKDTESQEKGTESVKKEAEKNTESPDKATPLEAKENSEVVVVNDTEEATDPLGEDDENKSNENRPAGQDDDCMMEYDAEDDDDFDPSLLCPEVSMAVDDNPVVTINGCLPNDEGPDSPLLCEPTFSTFVDEVTGAEISFNLTGEEQELRRRLYGPTNPIQITRIHCTACNVHLGSALEGQNNRFVHPLLKVIICKECYHFYTSGEFEKDEDGSELYCRWCGQGGQVLCCSKCEFVFCKRCVRTNFGRKKMFEIRDSDSWDCFRCNPQQIITQRISCYEFFEYVRREMSRASTLSSSEIWSKDHSRCCNQKKRALENGDEAKDAKKPKRKKFEDPDYNPMADKPDKPPLATLISPTTSAAQLKMKGVVLPKPIQLVSRYNKPGDSDIEFVRQIPAPHVTINQTRPTYRTILPSSIRPVTTLQPTLLRISAQPSGPPPLAPTTRILGNALAGRNVNATNMMKHEWFEKTVRAAARVNSHLSYTLTQLNKAQSQAASVEELAVVHNKLQEILSSSINSLIQIRKNLRTEFIAGIKTVRLPSKKVETTGSNDDDVIFVSAPPTLSIPSTSTAKIIIPQKDPLIIIDKSTAGVSTKQEWPKGFIKVKSVNELQNIPAECITIPDDPEPVTSAAKDPQVTLNGASTSRDVELAAEEDPLAGTPGTGNAEPAPEPVVTATIDLSDVPNDKEKDTSKASSGEDKGSSKSSDDKKKESPKSSTDEGTEASKSIDEEKEAEKSSNDDEKNGEKSEEKVDDGKSTSQVRTRRSKNNNNLVYNVKSDSSPEVKRMMCVKVKVQKEDLEELQKQMSVDKE